MAIIATLLDLLHAFYALQPPAAGAGGGGGGGGGAAGGAPAQMGCQDSLAGIAGPMLILFAFMYFFVMRPEQKRAKERDQMLDALKKGDKVRTNGGILGEIVRFENDKKEVVIEIAPKTRVNVLRGAVAGVAGTPAADSAGSDSEKK